MDEKLGSVKKRGGNQSKEHTELKNRIIDAANRIDGCFVWNNPTSAMPVDDRFIRFGTPGAPDILGVVCGSAIAIEVKTGSAIQSEAQKRWMNTFKENGGQYHVARDVIVTICWLRSI